MVLTDVGPSSQHQRMVIPEALASGRALRGMSCTDTVTTGLQGTALYLFFG